jgi:hypothetical protein
MSVQVKGYTFNFKRKGDDVEFEVETAGRDAQEQDEGWVQGYFRDVCKWETVATAISNLLGSKNEQGETLHDASEYSIEIAEREQGKIRGTVCLSTQERGIRTNWVSGASYTLPVEEIQHQIQNVEKWRDLKKSLGWLLESLTPRGNP